MALLENIETRLTAERKLLQSTAKLEFWETYEYTELFQAFESANIFLRSIQKDSAETEEVSENKDALAENIIENNEELDLLTEVLADDSLATDSIGESISFEEFALDNPLYAVLYPNVDQQTGQLNSGPVVGICAIKDTAQVNEYLNDIAIRKLFPVDVIFSYTVKPFDVDGKFLQLVALKSNRGGKAAM